MIGTLENQHAIPIHSPRKKTKPSGSNVGNFKPKPPPKDDPLSIHSLGKSTLKNKQHVASTTHSKNKIWD
jgi:hypothetical protein